MARRCDALRRTSVAGKRGAMGQAAARLRGGDGRRTTRSCDPGLPDRAAASGRLILVGLSSSVARPRSPLVLTVARFAVVVPRHPKPADARQREPGRHPVGRTSRNWALRSVPAVPPTSLSGSTSTSPSRPTSETRARPYRHEQDSPQDGEPGRGHGREVLDELAFEGAVFEGSPHGRTSSRGSASASCRRNHR